MEFHDDEQLRQLLKDLVDSINDVFSGSPEIKKAINFIEKKGFRVDMVMASITRIHRKEDEENNPEIVYEVNPFDKAFLQSLKIRLDLGEDTPKNQI